MWPFFRLPKSVIQKTADPPTDADLSGMIEREVGEGLERTHKI